MTERPLIGWKAIARHLGGDSPVTIKTAKKWIKMWYKKKGEDMPRTPTGKPMLYPSQIKEM